MSKTFLAYDGKSLLDYNFKLYKIRRIEYWKRRLKFWVWRKHRTMGKPILVRWKPLPTPRERQPKK